MNKKIYINYNTLANWRARLIHEMEKSFPDIEYNLDSDDIQGVELKDMWKHFEFPVFTHLESDFDVDGSEIENDIKGVTVDVSDKVETNPEYFRQFIYDNVFEVFGSCNPVDNKAIDYLNKLIAEGYDITVVSDFKGKIRGSVYYFLSRYAYQGNTLFTEEKLEETSLEEIKQILENNNG